MNGVSFKEAFLFWLKLGFISFGGPAGQIAIMHEYLVERKKWISESKFLHALNYCMLLPGPEAQQLATYMGWLMHGTLGGIVAGLLFILPSVFILLALSCIYIVYGNTALLTGFFTLLKPAVAAVILLAVYKIANRALKNTADYVVMAAALVALLIFHVAYPLIIITTVLLGIFSAYRAKVNGNTSGEVTPTSTFSLRKAGVTLLIFLLLWALPFILFRLCSSDVPFWDKLALFFTQNAFITFGGAYGILLYVSQVAVTKLQWLTQSQMLDGLALGESTPGPLIMVLTFVAFMGAYNHTGSLVLASAGLFTATFYTFLPSFAFILLGGPLVERTHNDATWGKVLRYVTAAVVAVIANLFFVMLAAIYKQTNGTDLLPFLWVLLSVFALHRFNINMIIWLLLSGLAGIILY